MKKRPLLVIDKKPIRYKDSLWYPKLHVGFFNEGATATGRVAWEDMRDFAHYECEGRITLSTRASGRLLIEVTSDSPTLL